MSNATVLGSIVWDVITNEQKRSLSKEEVRDFYVAFQADFSEKIDEMRNEQRRAYEEGKNLIVA